MTTASMMIPSTSPYLANTGRPWEKTQNKEKEEEIRRKRKEEGMVGPIRALLMLLLAVVVMMGNMVQAKGEDVNHP